MTALPEKKKRTDSESTPAVSTSNEVGTSNKENENNLIVISEGK